MNIAGQNTMACTKGMDEDVAAGQPLKVRHLPRLLVYGLALGVQLACKVLRRAAPLSVYRVRSALALTRFDCTAARQGLGWRPRVTFENGIRRLVHWFREDPATRQVYRDRLDAAG